MSYQSETAQYRHETLRYCIGNGIDLGSGGDPVTKHRCISFDQGGENMADLGKNAINFFGDARNTHNYFQWECFDYVYSSHLLEDFALGEWISVLSDWTRLVKPRGYLVLLVPDRELYHNHTPVGANQNHRHEPRVGELTEFFKTHFPDWKVLEDRLANPQRYTILFVAQKP